MKIQVTLPDGSVREFPKGTTTLQIAEQIGRRLAEAAIAAEVDGKVVDLNKPLEANAKVAIITRDTPRGLEVIRHSTAHLLAHAVKELYPETQITIGPVTEDGFYYDLAREKQFTPEDLEKLEKRMAEIVARDYSVARKEWSKPDAAKFFRSQGEKYKAEIIESIPDTTVSTYQQGEFIDLCRGPHVPNLKRLGAFKLLSVAGAYWRGDETKEMLQRIYGTAFATKKELDEHLVRLEEAKKRDHRRLGPEMGLFTFLPIAPSMPFYLPKGTLLFNTLADFMRAELRRMGYHEVICPQMMTSQLWKTSGHWGHFQDNMFVFPSEQGEQFAMALKPMNCPGHASLFKSTRHSYRELPLRFAEFSRLHRNERGGTMHGLLRTRTFSQDDGHIFCAPSDVPKEVTTTIRHLDEVYRKLGFEHIELRLATRPDSSLGTPEMWDQATAVLANSLKEAGKTYTIAEKEGAFYGPKIEFHVKDSLGRQWQCGTIQLDFNLPERFELEYVDTDGVLKRPAMIHRAIYGSLERFLGILIEHHAGHLPAWLAPTQAIVLSLTSDQEAYAADLQRQLQGWGVRAELDARGEKLGYKIREAQLARIPFMLVVGKQEAADRTVSVRTHKGETLPAMGLEPLREFMMTRTKVGGTDH